jgi:hypothetical protein
MLLQAGSIFLEVNAVEYRVVPTAVTNDRDSAALFLG